MNVKKMITGLALSMLMSSGMVAADYYDGLQAYNSGDFKTALAEWTPLAEQGNASAQYNLGVMYHKGQGVLKSDKTAVKWFSLSGEQGHAAAQYNLSIMYNKGEGVLKNDKTATKWNALAAENGNVEAQFFAGGRFEFGMGSLIDTKRAYMWYSIAAYNGSDDGLEYRDSIAKKMTPTQIDKAQDMSSRCLKSNYTDC